MSRPLRVVIVDDEPHARAAVRLRLDEVGGAEVVGEAGSGREAVQLIRSAEPDLVFLDVQMPEGGGLDVLESLEPEETPMIVFVTAFDRYAVPAFEHHAIDYLLKPFDRERFQTAFERARRSLATERAAERGRRVRELLDGVRERGRIRLPVREGTTVSFIEIEELSHVTSDGNYLRLETPERTHLVRGTMEGMLARLDSERFVRIHRSTIVNVDWIRDIRPCGSGSYRVRLRNDETLRLSRTYRDDLLERVMG